MVDQDQLPHDSSVDLRLRPRWGYGFRSNARQRINIYGTGCRRCAAGERYRKDDRQYRYFHPHFSTLAATAFPGRSSARWPQQLTSPGPVGSLILGQHTRQRLHTRLRSRTKHQSGECKPPRKGFQVARCSRHRVQLQVGRVRIGRVGSHQFHRPRSHMRAGTRMSRTRNASMATPEHPRQCFTTSALSRLPATGIIQ